MSDAIIERVSFGELRHVVEIDGIPVQHDNREGSYACGLFSLKEDYIDEPEEDEEGYLSWRVVAGWQDYGITFCDCERVAVALNDESPPFIWHEKGCRLEYRNEFPEESLKFL